MAVMTRRTSDNLQTGGLVIQFFSLVVHSHKGKYPLTNGAEKNILYELLSGRSVFLLLSKRVLMSGHGKAL